MEIIIKRVLFILRLLTKIHDFYYVYVFHIIALYEHMVLHSKIRNKTVGMHPQNTLKSISMCINVL